MGTNRFVFSQGFSVPVNSSVYTTTHQPSLTGIGSSQPFAGYPASGPRVSSTIAPSLVHPNVNVPPLHYNQQPQGVHADTSASDPNQPSWMEAIQEMTRLQLQQQLIAQQQQQEFYSTLVSREPGLHRQGHSTFRVPEIVIPSFDGTFTKYKPFKDLFLSTINRSYQTPVEKLSSLKSKLTGPAADVISHLTVSEFNYEKAWEMLDRMYENQKLQVAVNVDAIVRNATPDRRNPASILKYLQNWQGAWNNLDSLDVTTEQILVHLIIQGLDSETKGRLEDKRNGDPKMPSRQFLMEFLETEHKVILSSQWNGGQQREKQAPKKKPEGQQQRMETRVHAVTGDKERKKQCFICNGEHLVVDCPKFLGAEDRHKLIVDYKLCLYCLRHKWKYDSPCKKRSSLKCERCGDQHIVEMCHQKKAVTQVLHCAEDSTLSQSSILLPTAIAHVQGARMEIPIRCMIDTGSQHTYVTDYLATRLGQPRTKVDVTARGLNGMSMKITGQTTLTLNLKNPRKTLSIKAYIVPKVTPGQLPAKRVEVSAWMDNSLELADPHFYSPAHVGILFGNDVIAKLLVENVGVKIKDGLVLQKTVFGWVVSGSCGEGCEDLSETTSFMTLCSSSEEEEEAKMDDMTLAALTKLEEETLQSKLEKVWDFQIDSQLEADFEPDFCEKLYQDKHYRTEDGRYVVPITWNPDAPPLGHSYRAAVRKFCAQEWRWSTNEALRSASHAFMREYIDLGHAKLVPREKQRDESGSVVYIPYLSVIRQDATTTKFRAVFDASAKTSNGVSLNDTILPGPKLQTHIPDLLVGLRQHQYIYSADVSKMFRQILVLPEDQEKLRILWRPNRSEPIQEYALMTVTYGIDCAPFQAIRTLHQIAEDNAPDEDIKAIIKNNVYMDDVIFGAASIEEAQAQVQKITQTMEAGHFPLTKWNSNEAEVLKYVEDNKKMSAFKDLSKEDPTIKILGVQYHPKTDEFGFNVRVPEKVSYTKRGMLSLCASCYDPVGFILPVVMLFRILIQALWYQNAGWDDEIDPSTRLKFHNIVSSLHLINQIRIPRWTGSVQASQIELVGFSDASQDGIGACIYSRVKVAYAGSVEFVVRLIRARGNVTPLKTKRTIDSRLATIPKLELASIELLGQLFKDVSKCFKDQVWRVTAYNDSEIAIAWIRSQHECEDRNVRKKVSKIHKLISPNDLNHIASEKNMADAPSRGMTPEKLMDLPSWVEGPEWLKDEEIPRTTYTDTPCMTTTAETEFDDLAVKFSCLMRLLRIGAYIRRFKDNCDAKRLGKPLRSGPLLAAEVARTRQGLLRHLQWKHFTKEMEKISKGLILSKRSWLAPLCPFIDKDGLLRVGGRLDKSLDLTEFQKHPIILAKDHITNLIVRFTHENYLHAGNQLTERFLRDFYWIPAMKTRIKAIIKNCVVCLRWKAEHYQQPMADLPAERTTGAPSFSTVGCDLTGAFLVKASKSRFDSIVKMYLCAFVCFATKAVHLEIVDDLTTEAFLEAFSRFTSRRGVPTKMWTDCGSNFVGAARVLRKAWEKILHQSRDRLAAQEIEWTFNAPLNPSAGGYWEACMKSCKFFIKRAGNLSNLTFNQFYTLTCKIEAILNSRPLCKNSSDSTDVLAITPFQLVTLRSFKLSALDIIQENLPLTKRLIWANDLLHEFWRHFELEVLSAATKRYKWRSQAQPVTLDEVCLLMDPTQTPGQWKLGRIIKLYPDEKGVVRRVDLKTEAKDVVHRATNKIVPLITDEKEPIVRKSPRTRKTTIASVVTLLLILTGNSEALSVENLEPGVHLRKLGTASIIAFPTDFTITTPLNLTKDLAEIVSFGNEFLNFCDQFNGTDIQHLQDYCLKADESLREETNLTIEKIRDCYRVITKRSVPLVAGKMLIKYGPAVIMGGTAIYQGYQISKLNDGLEQMKGKVKRLTAYNLELDDIEYEDIDVKFNALLENQRATQIKLKITDYETSLRGMNARMLLRHQDAHLHFRPYDKLQVAVQKFNTKDMKYKLPPADVAFDINPPSRIVDNGQVKIIFTIPILEDTSYNDWMMMSVPNESGQATTLSNGELMKRIFISQDNTTAIERTHADVTTGNLLRNVRRTPLDECTKEILQHQNETHSCLKTYDLEANVFSAGEGSAIVIANPLNTIEADCGDVTEIISSSAWINYQNCSLKLKRDDSERNFPSKHFASLKSPDVDDNNDFITLPDDDEFEKFTKNPKRDEIRKKISDENSKDDFNPTTQAWFYPAVAAACSSISTSIILLFVFISKMNRLKRRQAEKSVKWSRWASQRYAAKGPAADPEIQFY